MQKREDVNAYKWNLYLQKTVKCSASDCSVEKAEGEKGVIGLYDQFGKWVFKPWRRTLQQLQGFQPYCKKCGLAFRKQIEAQSAYQSYTKAPQESWEEWAFRCLNSLAKYKGFNLKSVVSPADIFESYKKEAETQRKFLEEVNK